VKLTTREKRVIIIGACVVAAVLIYFAIALLLPNSENLSQIVDQKKRMLLKQRETLSREAIYKTRLEQFNGHLEIYRTRLLPGENPNVAGAELQKILKDFADQSGVEITQKNILPEKKTQDLLTKVSVKIDTNCNLEQLVHFIAAIENYEKHLKIDDCTISGFRIQKRFEIRPSLTIAGYISTREEKS
jgi:type II secretory pathway component PulM